MSRVVARHTEVARMKPKSDAFSIKVTDQVLARTPRDKLQSVTLSIGELLSHLRMQFTNGTVWAFDVPQIGEKNARQLVSALGGAIT
ncbi:MAG: hypothetical protein ABI427_20205 [Solirubrobacteraceae bacterium]